MDVCVQEENGAQKKILNRHPRQSVIALYPLIILCFSMILLRVRSLTFKTIQL